MLILAAAAMMACFLLLDISGVQPESAMNLRGSFSELLEAEEADLADGRWTQTSTFIFPQEHRHYLASTQFSWPL